MLNQQKPDLISLFQTCVGSYPESVAIEDCTQSTENPGKLTYLDLDVRSNFLARELRQNGVHSGDLVAVLSRRTPDAFIAMLAILKCGACYVPMDLDTWAHDRISSIFNLIQPSVVVSTEALDRLEQRWKVLCVSAILGQSAYPLDWSTIKYESQDETSQFDRLAYIIFTSGTTGKPKGVMVTMRSISAYVRQGDHDRPFNFNCTQGSRVLFIGSIAFDACIGITFSTLCNGGTLVLANTSTFITTAKRCTILPLSPSILSTLSPSDGYDNVKAIYLGGESPSPGLIQAWHKPGRRIFNAYGPTEATCTTLIAELMPGCAITVGWPISYSKVILLDPQGNESAEGEICIGGTGVAVGYFSDMTSTNKSFIHRDGERFYKTGDLGRLTTDGFVFRGRIDSMVKNRGFLIHLEGEVEPALLSYAKVTGAVAMKVDDRIVAFVTPKLDTEALREYLSTHVSSFIIPDVIYPFHEFPRTANGKIDRKALYAFHEEKEKIDDLGSLDSDISPIEATKKAFSLVLRLQASSITAETSFLQNGGHSLAAVKLASVLRKLGYNVLVSEIFIQDTINKLAQVLTPFSRNSFLQQRSLKSSSNIERVSPMTDLQTRMVRATMHSPSLHYIKVGMTFDHQGNSNLSNTLRQAWEALFNIHGIFRTSFDLSVDHGVQIVHSECVLNWNEQIVTMEEWDRARLNKTDACSFQQNGFPTMESLSFFHLVTVPGVCTRLIWTVHHSLVDGWSAVKVLGDLRALLNGDTPSVGAQFSEAAHIIHDLALNSRQKSLIYWRTRYQPFIPVNRILTPQPLTISTAQSEIRKSLHLPVSSLVAAARKFQVTPPTLVYGAWALLLSRYSNSEKITVGAVLSERSLALDDIEHVVGPLINTLPLCVDTVQATAGKFLESVLQSLHELRDVQHSSNALIQEATGAKGNDLFETILAVQYDFPTFSLGTESGIVPTDIEFKESTELPLTVLIDVSHGILQLNVLYSCSHFQEATITSMIYHFRNLLQAIVEANPESYLDEIHSRIFDGDDSPDALVRDQEEIDTEFDGPRTLQHAIQQTIGNFPNLCAVEGLSRSLSYEQLNYFSEILSAQISHVTRPGDVVCIISNGSIEWLVAIIAVIQSGCTYCPIDIKLPLARQKYMIAAAAAKVVLFPTPQTRSGQILDDVYVWDVESVVSQPRNEEQRDYSREAGADDIACLIFTSGSKGIPKAVQLQHKGIMSLLSWRLGRIHSKPCWRIAQTLSLGFDCCILEVFSAVCFGATLVLKDTEEPLAHLKKVNAMVSTPSLLATLEPSDYPNLQVIFVLGEALSQSLVDRWSPGRLLQNCYGPAECTLFVTCKQFQETNNQVSIGKPVPRNRCYILDKKLRPAPVGVKGEIYISGVQVTAGYRNDDIQTAAAFLSDPFTEDSIMFKTGDMGRWLVNGEIQYVGREDDLFKVRGFRIDLGDIEASILALVSDIKNTAVIVSSGILVAFVTPSSVDISIVHEKLKFTLPDYTVPTHIVPLDELPYSPNYKIDRKKLALMEVTKQRPIEPVISKTEHLVEGVWREVLGESSITREISAFDNFFDLGGHSLLQIRVAQKLAQALKIPFPLSLVIRHTSLRSLSQALDEQVASGQSTKAFLSSIPITRHGNLPLSFLEEELIINHIVSDRSPALNIIFAVELTGSVNIQAMDEAFKESVQQREVFLSRYKQNQGKVSRTVSSEPVRIQLVSAREQSFENFLKSAVNHRFDLHNEPLIQGWLYQRHPWSVSLIIILSHLIGDATTMNGFVRDHSERYKTHETGYPNHGIPSKLAGMGEKLSYIDWAHWSRSYSLEESRGTFWKAYLHDPPFTTRINQHSKPRTYMGNSQSWYLCGLLSKGLLGLCSDMSVTPHQLMLAAIALSTQVLQPSSDIILTAPYSLRTEPGTEALPGCFLDRILIRVRWARNCSTLQELLQIVRESSQAALSHAVPYCAIRKLLNFQLSLTKSLSEIMVTYHSSQETDETINSLFDIDSTEVSCRLLDIKPIGAKFPLLFEFQQTRQETISITLEHDQGIITNDAANTLASAFRLVLEAMIRRWDVNDIISAIQTGNSTLSGGFQDPPHTHGLPARDLSPNMEHIERIRDAFAQCLNIEFGDISPERSFFDAGGSSMDCVRLVWLLQSQGIDVGVRDVILSQTPFELAQVIKNL